MFDNSGECPYCNKRLPLFQLVRHMQNCGDRYFASQWVSMTYTTTSTSTAPKQQDSAEVQAFEALIRRGGNRE